MNVVKEKNPEKSIFTMYYQNWPLEGARDQYSKTTQRGLWLSLVVSSGKFIVKMLVSSFFSFNIFNILDRGWAKLDTYPVDMGVLLYY